MTPFGIYCHKRLPFGLHSAPSTYLEMIDRVLQPVRKFTLNYLDDVVCFGGENFKGHLENLDKVLTCYGKNGLIIKARKCELFQKEIVFLGHLVTREGITTNPKYIQAVLDLTFPSTKKQLKGVIGKFSYYARFIPNYSELAAPLTELTKTKANSVVATQEALNSFETLKQKLTKAPILAFPDFSGAAGPFRI